MPNITTNLAITHTKPQLFGKKNCSQVFERKLTLVLVCNFCSLFKTTSISYHILLLVGSYLLEKLRLAKKFYKTSLVLLILFEIKVNNLNY